MIFDFEEVECRRGNGEEGSFGFNNLPRPGYSSFDKLQGSAVDVKLYFMTRNDSRNISSLR